jgi:hypothetical protein
MTKLLDTFIYSTILLHMLYILVLESITEEKLYSPCPKEDYLGLGVKRKERVDAGEGGKYTQ